MNSLLNYKKTQLGSVVSGVCAISPTSVELEKKSKNSVLQPTSRYHSPKLNNPQKHWTRPVRGPTPEWVGGWDRNWTKCGGRLLSRGRFFFLVNELAQVLHYPEGRLVGWLPPPHLIRRDDVGPTYSRIRYNGSLRDRSSNRDRR